VYKIVANQSGMPYSFLQVGHPGMPFLCAILFMILSAPAAFARSLPLFSLPSFAPSQPNQKSDVQKFRVLVYPHQGLYPIPQGKELNTDEVVVTAAQGCTTYLAVLDAKKNWVKQGPARTVGISFSLQADGDLGVQFFPTPNLYYECAGNFTVQREKPLASISYAGDFVVVQENQQVEIINVVDPEVYLKGVIPSEISASWPSEVLKAQAIATRSYAWWTVFAARQPSTTTANPNYDMDDTVLYQAYLGTSTRDATTDSAADATAGTVMEYQNEVIKAYFSADSGGYSEDASSVFSGSFPYCQAKKEEYNVAESKTAWQKIMTLDDLASHLALEKLIPEKVAVLNVWVKDSDRTRSGRAAFVNVLGSDQKNYVISGNDFRYATKVRSNLFRVIMGRADITFDGKGYGHGVGMAQDGAYQYVKQLNWNFEKILNFYYTGITLVHE
jgi:SpoIID/LytB domain protein